MAKIRSAHALLGAALVSVVIDLSACGSSDKTGNAGSGDSAAVSSGGARSSGGVTGSGGNSAAAGGASATGGSSTSSGGNAGTGGATEGGGGGKGGNTELSVGGNTGSGGTPTATGGHTVTASGGASTTGGVGTGSGGTGVGGVKATGGSTSAGGANGGATGAIDASTGDAAAPACPPGSHKGNGQQYCSPPSSGTASGNYTYDLWSDGKGTGCITVYGVDATFKATWSNVSDWIARVGLAFDKTKTYDQLGTFSSDFSYTMTGVTSGGFGNIGIYGWTVEPLHEYYIAENWLGKKPNFTKVGTFTIEGEGTYDVMTNQQKNAANITGKNQDFVQFWSVNQTPRQCGHVSLSKHFDEWAKLGLQLGKMEETRILVEGQNNSGTIDFTTATVVVTK
jgi:hypothetical protein